MFKKVSKSIHKNQRACMKLACSKQDWKTGKREERFDLGRLVFAQLRVDTSLASSLRPDFQSPSTVKETKKKETENLRPTSTPGSSWPPGRA